MSVRMPEAVPTVIVEPSSQAQEMMARSPSTPRAQTSVRMPESPDVYNPDSRTISFSETTQTTDSRIDDTVVGYRTTWSSSKIQGYAQASERQLIDEYVSNYGAYYFSDYDETVYNDWTRIVVDAEYALNNGNPFYVAWSENRICQAVNADSNAEPRMTVIIDGHAYAMTDTGIMEVPIYNIVIQCVNREAFPNNGTKDRLYIDTTANVMYYWNGLDYVAVSSEQKEMHKLTFGADQEYVYDGSEDVTVPVYMGTIS